MDFVRIAILIMNPKRLAYMQIKKKKGLFSMQFWCHGRPILVRGQVPRTRVQNLSRDRYDSAESYPPRPWPVPDRYPSWSRNCGEDHMRGLKPTKMKNTELEPCILESSARSKKHACLFGSPKFPPEMELSNIKSRVVGLLLSSMEKWVSLIQVFD